MKNYRSDMKKIDFMNDFEEIYKKKLFLQKFNIERSNN